MKHILKLSPLLVSASFAEITLEPTLHLNAVTGVTSADNPSDLATHEHDPNDDISIQGLEMGLILKAGSNFSAFANINAFTTPDGEIDAEWEEGYIRLDSLPGGFEIRAGRFLNRLGLQNHHHLHAWDFANANLSTAGFLGEEGLRTEGLEATWRKNFDQSFFALTGSFGNAVQHGHEEEEEEGDDDEHEGAEDAFFSDEVFTTRALFGFNSSDFHQHRIGLNGSWGENGFGSDRDTNLYSIDYTYTWRENGLEAGGRQFSAGFEYFYRDVDWTHHDDPDEQGTSSQSGAMVFANYHFNEKWIAGLRYGYIEGVQDGLEIHAGVPEYGFEIEERQRVSLALTREFSLQKEVTGRVRLQYDHDEFDDHSEDSVWLQFGFDFGDVDH